jgi:hypothetical protein
MKKSGFPPFVFLYFTQVLFFILFSFVLFEGLRSSGGLSSGCVSSGGFYHSFLAAASISSGVTRRRSSARVRGGICRGERGVGVLTGVLVDRMSCGIGTSDGERGGNPFVDLTNRGRVAVNAMRSASSGVSSGASLIAFDMLFFYLKLERE